MGEALALEQKGTCEENLYYWPLLYCWLISSCAVNCLALYFVFVKSQYQLSMDIRTPVSMSNQASAQMTSSWLVAQVTRVPISGRYVPPNNWKSLCRVCPLQCCIFSLFALRVCARVCLCIVKREFQSITGAAPWHAVVRSCQCKFWYKTELTSCLYLLSTLLLFTSCWS